MQLFAAVSILDHEGHRGDLLLPDCEISNEICSLSLGQHPGGSW